jgi:hypothetical protein
MIKLAVAVFCLALVGCTNSGLDQSGARKPPPRPDSSRLERNYEQGMTKPGTTVSGHIVD